MRNGKSALSVDAASAAVQLHGAVALSASSSRASEPSTRIRGVRDAENVGEVRRTTWERTPWILSRLCPIEVGWLSAAGILLSGRVSSPRSGVPMSVRT